MRSHLHLRSYLPLTLATGVMLASVFSPLAVPPVGAQSSSTYYVSPSGSDSDSGSQSYPFATIQHANSVVAPGDTVIVEDGTYKGDTTLTANGSSGYPITYEAADKWGAKLVGTGSGDGSAVIRMSGAYTIIKGFDVTGSDANGIILAYAGTTASYNQAVGNYVHDMTIPCDSNGGAAIETGGGDNYSGITHNDMIGNLVVNILAPSGCTGAPLSAGLYSQIPYSVVANNIVINVGYGFESWHAASHVTVFGNTLVNDSRPITIGAGDAPGNITNDYSLVQNNIIYNSGSTAIAETTGGTSTTGTHNQYIDNLIYAGDTAISLNNGLQATGTVNANPLFVNNTGTAAGDYHVQSSSPARGAGLALAGILTDFDGTSRPQSGATVIGALLGTTTSGTATAGVTASPTSIQAGQSSVITWTTKNAVSAKLNGTAVALNGSLTVTPTATTTYTIVATSSTGATTSSSATVTVTSASATAGVTASPTSIQVGQSSVITWTTKNAVSAKLNGTAVALNGSLTVTPTATTTYTIVATSSTGATTSSSVTVTVTSAAATAGVTASPTSIQAGQSSVITWTTKNAVSAKLNGTAVALNGSLTVTPTATTPYTIVATSSTGATTSSSVTVTVTSAAATAGVTASPTSIRTGQSSVITWTTKNAVSAKLNGTTVALNGSLTMTPTATTTYTIVATSSTGATTSSSTTVTVSSRRHHNG